MGGADERGDTVFQKASAPYQTSAVRSLAIGAEAWFHDGSRMRREPHVRFCESVGVKLSRATLPVVFDFCGLQCLLEKLWPIMRQFHFRGGRISMTAFERHETIAVRVPAHNDVNDVGS